MTTRRLVINGILVVVMIAFFHYRSTHRPVDPKDAELATLPIGIEVAHSSGAVKAIIRKTGTTKYGWVYKTTVRSTVGPLKIVEFGSFNWRGGRWVLSTVTHQSFTSADFATRYGCPDAQLAAGQSYTGPHLNSSNVLPRQADPIRAYYIGVNSSGTRYKGEATLDLLPELASGAQ